MAMDALTPCLPGPSGQVFVRCLQIPALKIKSRRAGIGPGQEGGEGAQTNENRGGAIRANAWLGALGMGRVEPRWANKLGGGVLRDAKGRNQNKNKPNTQFLDATIPMSRLPPFVFVR